MYGWLRASSTEMRHSGSMTSILDSRSRAWPAVMATEEGQCYYGEKPMTSLHLNGLYENWLLPLAVLGNISGNVKICSLVSGMWSLTLNATDQGRKTFDLHGHSLNWLYKRSSFPCRCNFVRKCLVTSIYCKQMPVLLKIYTSWHRP